MYVSLSLWSHITENTKSMSCKLTKKQRKKLNSLDSSTFDPTHPLFLFLWHLGELSQPGPGFDFHQAKVMVGEREKRECLPMRTEERGWDGKTEEERARFFTDPLRMSEGGNKNNLAHNSASVSSTGAYPITCFSWTMTTGGIQCTV